MRITSGATGATLLELQESNAPLRSFRFGSALATVADEDGDGQRELVIGASGAPAPGGRRLRGRDRHPLLHALNRPE